MKLSKIFLLILTFGMFVGCKTASWGKNEASLELKGNPTTGYNWIYSIEDDSVISVEEKVEYLGKKGIVGAPSLFTYKIKALKPGNTKLIFEYKRPWENKDAEKVIVYNVFVSEDGKISVSESDSNFDD